MYPLTLSGFNEVLLHRQFFENPQITNFMKIRPVGDQEFHEDRQTDRHDEGNIRFSSFHE
jgi:hypothetical protein